MPLITSPRNPMIKQIRALRRRSDRERSGLFFAEGLRVVRAALEAGVDSASLIVAPDLISAPAASTIVAAFRTTGGHLVEVSAEVFTNLSQRDGPQGLAIVGRQRWAQLPAEPDGNPPWIALCGVQQPGNLGAVLRTCDAAGAAGLVLLGATTDPYDPAAIRASMGTVFSQRLVRTDQDTFVGWIRSRQIRLIGSSGEGGRDYRALPYRPPLVLLMGAERQGLPPPLLAQCDDVAHIPMAGRADSLNVAVATGLMLYEAVRNSAAPVQR